MKSFIIVFDDAHYYDSLEEFDPDKTLLDGDWENYLEDAETGEEAVKKAYWKLCGGWEADDYVDEYAFAAVAEGCFNDGKLKRTGSWQKHIVVIKRKFMFVKVES